MPIFRLPKPRVTGSSPAYRSKKGIALPMCGAILFLMDNQGAPPVSLVAPSRGRGCQYRSRTTRACTSFESRLPLMDYAVLNHWVTKAIALNFKIVE